jgi:adenylosuccinate synthase
MAQIGLASTDTRLNRATPAELEKGDKFLVDEANGSDRSTDGEFTWTPEEETKVRRKLDRVIVPLTTFLYLLCFLDRYGLSHYTRNCLLTTSKE